MPSIFDSPNYRPFEKVVGKISINVRDNYVSFSKQLLSKLNYAHYVQVFINLEERKIGIRVCEKEAPNALNFVPEGKSNVNSLRWSNPQFTRDLRAMVDERFSSQDFTCSGDYLSEENAVLIDMDSPALLKKA